MTADQTAFVPGKPDPNRETAKGKNITEIQIKDEGPAGPLYCKVNGEWLPYEVAEFGTKWFTYAQAERIAKKLNLTLEYC